MESPRDYVSRIRREVKELNPQEAKELLAQGGRIVDVRESEEYSSGFIPGAHHLSRGYLETRIEEVAPQKDQPLILYCASGVRSALAGHTLKQLGYQNVYSLKGGIILWRDEGLEIEIPKSLSAQEKLRYSRHTLLPEIGMKGQLKLLESKVLLIGAGGLGSPAALYLAAAGVGTIGIVDLDQVELSNLQRQILHGEDDFGKLKVDSASESLLSINSEVRVNKYPVKLEKGNVMEILEGYDLVIDGTDNFPTRYLLNEATVRLNVPLISASILGFDGQLTVFTRSGPCYRCLYPEPPPPELAPTCGVNGVLGVLPGVMGLLQATEAIKLITQAGEPLVGRLLLYQALEPEFRILKLVKDPGCPTCSNPDQLEEFEDYQALCAV